MSKQKIGEDYFEEYVAINEIKQYFVHYKKESDVVVLFLHGGMSEAHFGYKNVLKERMYTFVYYDQRGTGKTQAASKSKPEAITMEALVKDLDETVNYVRKIYPNKKLILFAHSRGSVLGMNYIKKYGEKVDAYVGMGQLVNFKAGLEYTLSHLKGSASESDMKKLEAVKAAANSQAPENLKKACIDLEQLQTKYKHAGYKEGGLALLKVVKNSPLFKLSDIVQILSTMKNNSNLFPCVGGCDFYNETVFKVPV